MPQLFETDPLGFLDFQWIRLDLRIACKNSDEDVDDLMFNQSRTNIGAIFDLSAMLKRNIVNT